MKRLSAVPSGEPIAISATLFVTYRRCPQQALARLRGVYPEPSRATFKGALAHRIFARHLTDGPIGEEGFNLVCRQETGANLSGQMAAAGLRKPSEFDAVVSEIADLYERFRRLPADGFTSAEVAFDHDVTDDIAVRGRIDAVFEGDAGARLVDWKTGSDLGHDVEAQLGFYAFTWSLENGSPPAETVAVSLATGERVASNPSADDVAAIEDEVASMVVALRSALEAETDLSRTAGPYCRWCPICPECSEGKAAVALLG
ncbi:MAG: PD-(D/E)XK nuclease family protein [Acidimicrobiia bacterium]|nr:PD-(D/E)XK nuclease family protein [Acidimicrobiia bacterium]